MRQPVLWFVLGAAACASTTQSPVSTGVTSSTVAVAGMPGKLTVTSSATASVTTLTAPVDRVWQVVPAILDSLGIKVSLIDPASHTIGVEQMKVRVQLGSTPLSRYLDCGQTQIGQNADSYEVLLNVIVRVQASPTGGSSLHTLFDAVARPIAFRQDYSRCSSKGLFESRVADAVKKKLQP